MNANLYSAGKASGDAGVTLHGETTLLVKVPGGFDPGTGAKLPPIEQGFQREDLQAMRDAAVKHFEAVELALVDAADRVAALDALLEDADTLLAKKK